MTDVYNKVLLGSTRMGRGKFVLLQEELWA